jgi:hypothetical protein
MKFFQLIKPSINKRYLLFVAAIVWTFAGGMLLYRGFSMVFKIKHLILILMFSAIGGILFYMLLFSKISLKHTKRILSLKSEKPCAFSFFNFKSYILMTVMISSGIIVRKSGIISPDYLSLIYITMGIPLFLSAFRFYYNGINYKQIIENEN